MNYTRKTKDEYQILQYYAGRGKQFSYNGLDALYEYLDEQEDYSPML